MFFSSAQLRNIVQVANYGLGGQYSTHLDPHGYWDGNKGAHLHSQIGDRLATIMVYLADVKAGGATAFPNTGVRVRAVAGKNIWENI